MYIVAQVRLVQWYPGHIARAEKLLREQLKAVDAIVEVRDIRIPLATTHPDIPQWIGSKLRVLVLNRADMVRVSGEGRERGGALAFSVDETIHRDPAHPHLFHSSATSNAESASPRFPVPPSNGTKQPHK